MSKSVSLLFFLSSIYFTIWCQKKTSDRRNNNIPLPDILHTSQLDISRWYRITNIPINAYIFFLIYTCFRRSSSCEKIPIFFLAMGMTYFIRALSFSMTILPKCGKMKDKNNTRSCNRIIYDYLSLKDTHIGHNNDLLPSGHVCFSHIFWMFVTKYKIVDRKWSNFILLINIINSLLIVMSRCHYSIDVFYAYLLSSGIFSFVIRNTKNILN